MEQENINARVFISGRAKAPGPIVKRRKMAVVAMYPEQRTAPSPA